MKLVYVSAGSLVIRTYSTKLEILPRNPLGVILHLQGEEEKGINIVII
jgi:hypothetical protein